MKATIPITDTIKYLSCVTLARDDTPYNGCSVSRKGNNIIYVTKENAAFVSAHVLIGEYFALVENK